MATINIIFQQPFGEGYNTPGSRDNLVVGTSVTAFNEDNTGITSWTWEFINIPFGSSSVLVTNLNHSATFTPDIVGTYLLRLTASGGSFAGSKTEAISIRTVNLNLRLPAAKETTQFDGYYGWAKALNESVKTIDAHLSAVGITPGTYQGITFDAFGRATGATDQAYLPKAGGVMVGAITFSGTQLGTYTLGGTPTIGASLAIGTTATYNIGDTTHLLTRIATAKIIGGSSNTTGHTVPNIADDTFALLAAAQTLTNKTITAPILSGSVTGTYTFAGTPSLGASLGVGTDNIYDIGDPTHRINDGYFTNLISSQLRLDTGIAGTYSIGGAPSLAVSLAIGIDNSFNIGDATHRLGSLFTENILSGNVTLTSTSAVANGASAVGHTITTSNTLSTTAKIASWKNNGTEKAFLNNDGYFVAIGHLGVDGYKIDLSSGAATNQFLGYDGSKFSATNTLTSPIIHTPIIDGYLIDLSAGATNGQVLEYNGTKFVAGAVSGSTQEQTISAAATISVNVASGSLARITLGTTAITTINVVAGSAAQILQTEIIQDSAGGRAISGWSTGWRLTNGSYIPTPTANARDIISWVYDNTSSLWVETARSMNVLSTAAPTGERLWLSVIDLNLANNGGADAVNVTGTAQVNASEFYFSQATVIYGCRFYWAGTTARTVRVKLWTSVGQQATVSVNTTGAGTYFGYFSTQYTAEPYTIFVMSVFDLSGNDYTKIDTASLTSYFPTSLNQSVGTVTPAGKALVYKSIATFRLTDDSNIPGSHATNERYLIDPIYEVLL